MPQPEVTEEYIRIRVKNPKGFQENSFRTIDLSKDKGVKAIIGKLKGATTTTTQSFLFVKDKWTVENAQKWVEKREMSMHFNSELKEKIVNSGSFDIKGMEVFKVGIWNKINFTLEDLEIVVKNFNDLKDVLTPRLKLTHSDDQESLAGLASYGDVTDVYIKDNKLYANFSNVPGVIIEWIKERRFSERSIELWTRFEYNKVNYRNVLTAVSLLGHEVPAVLGMRPTHLPFSVEHLDKNVELVKFSLETEQFNIDNDNKERRDMNLKEETKIKELEATIEKMSAELDAAIQQVEEANTKDLKDQVSKMQKELKNKESLKEELQKTKDILAEKEKQIEIAFKQAEEEKAKKLELEIETFVSNKKSEGKVIPAIEEDIKLLYKSLANSTEKITFSKDDEEVETSVLDLFKNVIEKTPGKVEFAELAKEEKIDQKQSEETDSRFSRMHNDVEGIELDSKIRAFMKKENIDYGTAMIKINEQERSD